MGMVFMNTENSKVIDPNKFILNLSQRLYLRHLSKHFTPQNLPIYLLLEKYKTTVGKQ